MSLRLQMLQIARVAPKVLGDSADLVRAFFTRQFSPEGGAMDRAGQPDLYYTIFALAGLQAMQSEEEIKHQTSNLKPWLASFGDGAALDFVHLSALARCWAALGREDLPAGRADAVLARIETHRSRDGGYDGDVDAERGNAYGCFVALGAYQDLGQALPDPLRMVQCLKFLETPDGAWANARGLKVGSTNATAAAVTLMHQLNVPVNQIVGDWLLAQAHPDGGFLAMPSAPMPDLLSTATTLHALSCLDREVPPAIRERCLDFIDTLWNAEGGFHGHWADDHLDAEYTFYGLLALGHLSV
ncbi:MAG: prenyltransferase/squalene oxidase repeat-containing protein [Chthoniobacter sp.]|uniref:prenyltransferase/squalene oxidase repeat-containing protein n=1 Tax=Chthoniobacter sp. TaxID=2510640 RepID=UPI0032AACC54